MSLFFAYPECKLTSFRVRQLLRISYAHVQVVMYRPFLHYVSSGSQARGVDRRSYACAAACVSVSRNIVHITTGMHKRGLLNGSFWFTMYTTYFAILSLLFFVLENPDSPTAKDGVLKDAMEGKNTLAGLAKKSMAADRCSQSLNSLFKNLPELLKNRQTTANPVNLKRPAPSSSHQASNNTSNNTPAFEKPPPQRSSTFPIQLLNRGSKGEASNTPKSLDDNNSQHRRTPSNTRLNHASTWFASTPEGTAETASTPSDTYPVSEPVNVSSNTASPMPMSLPMRDAPATQFATQSFNTNPANLPDLMGIMFPSDDPFAYPTQPMSTLEDGHFRQDGGAPFGVNPPTQQSGISSGPDAMGMSTPKMETFANFPLFPNSTPTPMQATLPTRMANPPQISQSRLQSPVSHASTPGTGEAVNSPDLVSLPNNNYMWQGYNFQPQNFQQGLSMPASMPSGQAPDIGMGLDDTNSLGMGIDLGISLDEIFGDSDMTRGGLPIDDWSQWNPSG